MLTFFLASRAELLTMIARRCILIHLVARCIIHARISIFIHLSLVDVRHAVIVICICTAIVRRRLMIIVMIASGKVLHVLHVSLGGAFLKHLRLFQIVILNRIIIVNCVIER